MLTRRQKIKYLCNSILALGQEVQCPFCKSMLYEEIDRKYWVTRLMECKNCHLYYRFPVDKVEVNDAFYQTEYQESDAMASDLPDDETLRKEMESGFASNVKHGARFLNLFNRLFPDRPTLRIVDYCCSWGYMAHQFKQAGHEVQGYEISRPRAAFGTEKMGLNIYTREQDLKGNNDIFFSSHVIEHHPDIGGMLRLAEKILAPGGYFIAVSPNGSPPFREKFPESFHLAWGKVHPNYLNGHFYQYIFRDRAHYIGSSPFNLKHIGPLRPKEMMVDDLSGEELLVIARFG
ncbi:MAG TPA: methyltransferase domain-containing protein [Puia sp.]